MMPSLFFSDLHSTGYNFDPSHINVEVTSNCSNSLYISAISPTNDPKEHLTVVYSISQKVINHGSQKWIANLALHKTENVKIYDSDTTKLYNEFQKNLTFEHGAVKVFIVLRVSETFNRAVDFSNLTIPSRINYNACILTQVNITFPSTSSSYEDKLHTYNYLEDESQYLQNEFSVPFTTDLISLANVSAQEETSNCVNADCSSSDVKITFGSMELADDIEVKNLIVVNPEASSFREIVTDKIGLYSSNFYINVNYTVAISNTNNNKKTCNNC